MPDLRPARAADVPAIEAIYAHHVLHGLATFEEVPPDAAEMARRLEEIAGRGLPYLVAEEAGRLLGYAYAAPYRARSAYRFTLEDSIYLDPAAVGRGIGSAASRRAHRCRHRLGRAADAGGDRRQRQRRPRSPSMPAPASATPARSGPSASSSAAGSTPC